MRMKRGVWFVCEDRQSEFHHDGTTGLTFASTRTQKYARGRGLMTHEDQILIPLPALGRARCLRPRGHG